MIKYYIKILIIIIIILLTNKVFPQDFNATELSINKCYKMAIDGYPQKKNIKLVLKSSDIKIKNLQAKYYPAISLIGQAQYQTDITKIDINIPIPGLKLNFPEMPKDQYKIGVSIDQTIWDGGIVSSQKDLEKIQGKIDSESVEMDLYNLYQKVNDVYFLILNLQEREKSINLLIEDLKEKSESVQSRVQNGVLLESNLYILQAQIANSEQSLIEIISSEKTAFDILSELINTKIDYKAKLALPDADISNHKISDKSREEYKLFDLNREYINQSKYLINSKYMPKFSAYAQGIYGKPGLNMFDPDFKAYGIFGVKAQWSLWNWDVDTHEKEMLEIQKEVINNQEETFSKNLNLSTAKYFNDIKKYEDMIIKDNEIIELRKKIKIESSNQLDNGIITSTEYLTQINSESQARLQLEIDKIFLIQTKVNYLTQIGYVAVK